MIPSMAVGIAVGTLVAAALSAAHIRLAIGLIAGAFVLRHWLGQRFERLAARADEPGSGRVSGARTLQWPRWPLASLASAAHADTATGIAFGARGGVTTLLANAGGPAWQMHLLPRGLDKLTYVGTMTMLFAASNILKIPAYAAIGQLTFENLAVGAALLPAAVVANYAGIWLVRRTPTELFFRIVYVLMFLIAIELMRGSLTELWRD